MNQVFLSLGSNVGNRSANLQKAINLLDPGKHSEMRESFIYETEPWGPREQRNFYNQVIEFSTYWDPLGLLEEIHRIETVCGRKLLREQNAPRPIDIDILFYNDRILTTDNLKIPHPLIHMRRFVLVPMMDLAPGFRHPVLGKTMTQLLAVCEDTMKVVRIS